MQTQNEQLQPTPPSLVASLRKGFDAIANHPFVILFPIGLDVFLWLGPHLKITRLVEKMLATWNEFYSSGAFPNEEAIRVGQQVWTAIGERLNLFIFLRSYPVGVFSLMAGIQPIRSPLGEPYILQASSLSTVLFAWLACSLLGIFAGSYYFSLVAQAAVNGVINWMDSLRMWVQNSLQISLLTIFSLSMVAMVGLPCSCLISFLTFGNLAAAQMGILIMLGILVWMFSPLVFTPHGIFVRQENMWQAITQSIKLTRFTFPNTLFFLVVVFAIGEGMDMIWRFPKETSWLTLVGIAGHGFVTTALLATTFVYYRDAVRWVNEVSRRIETASVS
ncbi:MAG: hypothetical protein N3D16_01045 [Anaerolineales bacterium]|nr:hypothetical protein [Anaerolineales bacterium]